MRVPLRCRRLPAAIVFAAALALQPQLLSAQKVTSPKEQFGFSIGDDYKLANYTQFEAYFRKLAKESNRMKLVEMGKTAEGRTQLMAIISSPANLAKLERYKEISRKLAFAEGVSEAEARALAKEGKAVVWIDGGLHATEVLGAAQLIETVYQLVSKSDAETMRFLDDCIILAAHANPDGMELVSNWYMKDADTLKRSTGNIPRLYQKYIGHDNNRDFYISNQPESQNVNHQLYWEWFPQIVYNHHQTGPAGTVMFAPPFRDPFNYNFDPLVPVELDLVAAAMHSRFEAEGKPGVTMRSGSNYSTWWNGGLRTTVYFHNQIGLLTETIGNPTPVNIPFIPEAQLPRADLPYPIAPQRWHFRQSIEYSLTANRAVLDIASRYRENLLYNFYRMGRNSIERGNKDSWTITGQDIEDVKRKIAADSGAGGQVAGARGGRGGGAGAATAGAAAPGAEAASALGDVTASFGRGADPKYFTSVLHAPEKRDPRGYILPSDQPDFPTTTKFINSLRHVGVIVNRATAPFTVKGKQYPAGSYVVKSAQAFRPHVLDMFEPQDHPNDFAYPGGPPKRPYDNAGYTLAYQMGVKFDRIMDGFDGPFEEIQGLATPMPASVAGASAPAGYIVSHAVNDAFLAVNRALKANGDVFILRSPLSSNGKTYPAGSFYIAANAATTPMVRELARTKGVAAEGVTVRPGADAKKLRSMRVALWDQYGGSMPSGHTRWLLEQFEFPFEVVYPQTVDAGNLASKYDVIVLPSGVVPSRSGRGGGGGFGGAQDTMTIPAEFRGWLGRFNPARTVPALKQFLEAGGTVVAVGTSANLGIQLGLPITNALVEKTAGAPDRDLNADKFYVPGSVLRVQVDTTLPISAGLSRELDVFYDNSPAYRLGSDAAAKGVRPLAWISNATPLRSGWAWGQSYLDGAVEAIEATVGKGKLYMFAPEITFRGQPHGTFKWLFNGIYGGAEPAIVP